MKKLTVLLVALIFAVSFAGSAIAADKTLRGTITGINASTGEVSFCPAGSTGHQDFKAGKSLDLKKFKKGDKVKIAVTQQNQLKSIQPDRARRMITGC